MGLILSCLALFELRISGSWTRQFIRLAGLILELGWADIWIVNKFHLRGLTLHLLCRSQTLPSNGYRVGRSYYVETHIHIAIIRMEIVL